MKVENKQKTIPENVIMFITFSGKTTLNFFINLTLYFFINFILTFTHEIDIACEEQIKTIISQLLKQENVTEELKNINQMEWVRCMNSIKNRAEEIVFNELIYVQEVQNG